MTIRKLPAGGAWAPLPVNFKDNTITPSGVLYVAVDDGITGAALIFTCPVSGTLDSFEFFADFGGVDPDSTLNISFQALDASDLPDGIEESRVIRVGDFPGTWIQPGLMTTDGTDLGQKRTVTRGEKLACVIVFESSTAGDNFTLGATDIRDDTTRNSVIGTALFDGVSWARTAGANVVGWAALKYDSFQPYHNMPELLPIEGVDGTSFNIGTTPDEVGLEFSFPAPVRIGGASMCLFTAVDGAEFECVVYDQLNNVLDTVPMKMYDALRFGGGYSYWTARFSQDIYVPGNEPYKITVKSSSTDSISLLEIGVLDTVRMQQVFGYLDTGSNEHFWQHIEQTDGGGFTADATLLPLISLNITGVDMDAGGATDGWTGDA